MVLKACFIIGHKLFLWRMKTVLRSGETYITTHFAWDQSVAMLEAEVAEIPVYFKVNGGSNALFYNQHISYKNDFNK
jgi:hypothetical protein